MSTYPNHINRSEELDRKYDMDIEIENTWGRMCQQVGKKRFEYTPKDSFGQPLKTSKSIESHEKEKSDE